MNDKVPQTNRQQLFFFPRKIKKKNDEVPGAGLSKGLQGPVGRRHVQAANRKQVAKHAW
jgi:hypothetical protein